MAEIVREVMTPTPVALPLDCNLVEAARTMRECDIGNVIVMEDGHACGIVTDRDITIRATAESKDPRTTPLADVCSRQLVTVRADQPVGEAVRLMRAYALRRLPVVEDGKVVGIVSLGDLMIDRDPRSALADITTATPNV